MSGHYEGVGAPDTMGCVLVHGSPREIRWGEGVQKPLIFMRFHGVFLGKQHEIWSKQHNGKVSVLRGSSWAPWRAGQCRLSAITPLRAGANRWASCVGSLVRSCERSGRTAGGRSVPGRHA